MQQQTEKIVRSRIMRLVYIGAGWFFVAAGFIGIFLPLLPTTPFLLLAAACFSRGSDKLHAWLLQHPRFGTFVSNWEQHRVIPRRAKLVSSVMMTVMIGYPVFVYPHPWWFKAFLILTCVLVSRYVWSCPHAAPLASVPASALGDPETETLVAHDAVVEADHHTDNAAQAPRVANKFSKIAEAPESPCAAVNSPCSGGQPAPVAQQPLTANP